MALGAGGKVGTGYVEIKPDTKGFGAELERGVEGQGRAAGSKLGGAVGMAAKGAFAAGVAGMAKGVFDFGGFESGMNEVFTLMPDMAGEARDEMTANVKAFSAEFGVIPDEVIPSLYNSISAGVPPDNVFEFLEQSQKLAKGGATDLATAVDGLSSVVNAYGPETLSAAEASDALFTAVKLGKTTVDEMSASLFQVAPIAAATGIGFDEVSASIATLTAQGTPTSVAATQMKGAISELGKEGSKAWKSFEDAAGQTFPEFIDGGGTLTDALDLMNTAADENGSSISNMFGSLEAGQAALGIVKDLDKSAANLAAVGDAAGATDVAFDTMNQGLSATMDKLRAKFAVTLIDLGEALAPTIETVGMALAGLVDMFNSLPGPVRTGIVIFGTLAAGMVAFAGPLLKAIKLFGMMGKAMSLLAANPWMIAVLALIAVTYLIIKNWDDVVDALETAWDWIKSAGQAVGDFFVDLWETVTDAVVVAWDGMVSGIVTALDAIGSAVVTAWDAVTEAIVTALDAIWTAITTTWDAITGAISWSLDLLETIFVESWDAITGTISTAWSTISGIVTGAVEAVRAAIDFGFSLVSEVVSRNVAFWTSVIETAWNSVLTTTSFVWGLITGAVDSAVGVLTGIFDRVLAFPGNVLSGFETVASAIAAPFEAAFSAIKSAWNSTVGGFTVSIPSVFGFGGASFSIPSMALGGLAASPMLAMVGDAGPGDPEIVSPVSLMRETLSDAMADSGGGGSYVFNLTMNVDAGVTDPAFFERQAVEMTRVVQREIERQSRAQGRAGVGIGAAA